MGRGVIITLLVVSAALNIFMFGVFSGRLIHGAFPHPPRQEEQRPVAAPDNPFRMMRYADELPEATREKFRIALKEGLPQARENYKESRRLREELAALLKAEELDRDQVSAKMAEIQAQQAAQRAAFDKAFLDALETLSSDERRQLLQAAEKHRKDFRKRLDMRRGPDGPGMGPDRKGPPPEGMDDMPPPEGGQD